MDRVHDRRRRRTTQRSTLTVVDLFSGTGAATAAFEDRGHHVLRVDLRRDEFLRPDVRADVRRLPPSVLALRPDFVWASPPCQDFSWASVKNCRRDKAGGWPERGMQLVAAACDAIAALDPPWWVVENVQGARRWLGPPTKRVGSIYLWGRFPDFDCPPHVKGFVHRTAGRNPYSIANNFHKKPHTRHLPAMMPYSLSRALCLAIEAAAL